MIKANEKINILAKSYEDPNITSPALVRIFNSPVVSGDFLEELEGAPARFWETTQACS